MKTLFIARHAKSSWDNPDLDDFDRPLNKRGKNDAPVMGQRLKQKGIKPDLIVSSSANRAYTTSVKIAKEIGYPKSDIKKTEKLYMVSVSTVLKVIQQTDNNLASLMIFGHNPCWTELSNFLCDARIDNIPTCGISAIAFDVNNWSEVNHGKGKLIFFDYPKKVTSSL